MSPGEKVPGCPKTSGQVFAAYTPACFYGDSDPQSFVQRNTQPKGLRLPVQHE